MSICGIDYFVVDHSAGISYQTTHAASNVTIDLENLFDTRRLQKRRCDALLYCQDHSFGGLDTYACRTQLEETSEKPGVGREVEHCSYLDSFNGVLDLEESTFRGERVDTSVIFTPISCDEIRGGQVTCGERISYLVKNMWGDV